MKPGFRVLALFGSWTSSLLCAGAAWANAAPVSIEIIAPDGHAFREFPVSGRDGSLRSYLQAEKGARYQVRVHNTTGERLGLVIAVDGRNIISGQKSELSRGEPMYVLAAWDTESYAGWRANLEAVNEFYFTDWKDSYADAFGDRSARGVIALAIYREVPPQRSYQPRPETEDGRADARPVASSPAAGASGVLEKADAQSRDESVGTGYGERRVDRAVEVEFVAQRDADSRHFIKYEWRETLCRKQVLECGEPNRFWDESMLGFAPPPPQPRR